MHLSLDDATRPRLTWPDPGQLRWLVGISAVGLLLRLLRLEDWGFWVDEAHTFRDAVMPLDLFDQQTRSHYPLAFHLLRILLDLMPNDSEGWVRLPFAFFGAVTVPLMGFLMAPMVGARAALVAAALLAINPWHIYWSQNARFYVLTALLSLVAVGLVYQGLYLRRLSRVAWGGSAALLGGLSHLPVFALLPALLAGWWLGRGGADGGEGGDGGRDRRLMIVAIAAGMMVFVLPVVLPWLPGMDVFIRAKGDASLVHLAQTSAYYFRIPLMLTAMAGLWFAWRRERLSAALLGAWLLLPPMVLVAAGTVAKTTGRYVFFVQPAMLAFCGVAVVGLWDAIRAALAGESPVGRWVAAGLLPLLLLADSSAADYLYYTREHGDRPRWGEAARLIEEKAGARPTLVVTTNGPTMRYYLDRSSFRSGQQGTGLHRIFPVFEWELEGAEDGGAALPAEQLAIAEARGLELFVVTMTPELAEKDREGGFRRLLQEEFRVVGAFRNHVGPRDLTIYVYRPLAERGRGASDGG